MPSPISSDEATSACKNMELALLAISLIPLKFAALLDGKAIRPFFSELSGISPSRLREGRSWIFRQSTITKIKFNVEQSQRSKAIGNGWTEIDIESLKASAPSTIGGVLSPFAILFHSFQLPGILMLPLSISFAVEVDTLFNGLLTAVQSNDIEKFKDLLLSCKWGEGVPNSKESKIAEHKNRSYLELAKTWSHLLKLIEPIYGNLLLFLVAALDAEYCSVYFGKFEPRPLLLLVTPKLAEDFNINDLVNIPKRNWSRRPYRRLFEICHGMLYWYEITDGLIVQ
jgi:hypothetical protein